MIEGDAQTASQEKTEEKGRFIRSSTPPFLALSLLFLFLFLSHLRYYPFLVFADPTLACLPRAFTAT